MNKHLLTYWKLENLILPCGPQHATRPTSALRARTRAPPAQPNARAWPSSHGDGPRREEPARAGQYAKTPSVYPVIARALRVLFRQSMISQNSPWNNLSSQRLYPRAPTRVPAQQRWHRAVTPAIPVPPHPQMRADAQLGVNPKRWAVTR